MADLAPRAQPDPKERVILDELDLKILRSLNKNARKSFRDIARELGISLSTVSHRVKRLEENGVVRAYVPAIDAQRIGYDLVVIIGVRIAHGKLIDVQQRIARDPRVFGVYDVTGEWDSMILARFRDRDELNDFIKDMVGLEHVERTSTQLVLNTVKEERRVVL
jgi:DNA-binding Lrp family transcriptional regulator